MKVGISVHNFDIFRYFHQTRVTNGSQSNNLLHSISNLRSYLTELFFYITKIMDQFLPGLLRLSEFSQKVIQIPKIGVLVSPDHQITCVTKVYFLETYASFPMAKPYITWSPKPQIQCQKYVLATVSPPLKSCFIRNCKQK